jgi:hypothetical protein
MFKQKFNFDLEFLKGIQSYLPLIGWRTSYLMKKSAVLDPKPSSYYKIATFFFLGHCLPERPLIPHIQAVLQSFDRTVLYTGCEGYCRPIFKIFSCISRLSDHDKIFTVYPPLHLLLSTSVHLPARLKGPRQESQRGSIVKIIRAGRGKPENKKFKKQGI